MNANLLNPNFSNRDEYRTWRSAWKASYLELSQRIRAEKLTIKDCQRNGLGASYSWLKNAKNSATLMLSARVNSKVRAHDLWQLEQAACLK